MMQLRDARQIIVARILRQLDLAMLWTAWDAIASRALDLVTIVQKVRAAISARYVAIIDKVSPRQERGAAITAVALIHVIVAFALIFGLRSHFPIASHEVEMTLGGPIGMRSEAPQPKPIIPKLPTAPPPLAQSEDTFQANIVQPSGSPNVTTPAEAIAAEHVFPPLPSPFARHGTMLVRLVISITPDGAIDGASVQQSSGNSELDELAIAWVMAHWRYTPAMQDGRAIAVSTTAVVTFTNA